MTKKLALDAGILLGLLVLGVAGYRLAPLLAPKTDLALPLAACDLNQQGCAVALPDGGRLEFSIEPRPIPVLKPLRLRASVQGSAVRQVEVDFAGTEMKMGFNRPKLDRQAGDDARFAGSASLPVCITGTMEWEATVLVDTGTTVIAAPFRFVSSR